MGFSHKYALEPTNLMSLETDVTDYGFDPSHPTECPQPIQIVQSKNERSTSSRLLKGRTNGSNDDECHRKPDPTDTSTSRQGASPLKPRRRKAWDVVHQQCRGVPVSYLHSPKTPRKRRSPWETCDFHGWTSPTDTTEGLSQYCVQVLSCTAFRHLSIPELLAAIDTPVWPSQKELFSDRSCIDHRTMSMLCFYHLKRMGSLALLGGQRSTSNPDWCQLQPSQSQNQAPDISPSQDQIPRPSLHQIQHPLSNYVLLNWQKHYRIAESTSYGLVNELHLMLVELCNAVTDGNSALATHQLQQVVVDFGYQFCKVYEFDVLAKVYLQMGAQTVQAFAGDLGAGYGRLCDDDAAKTFENAEDRPRVNAEPTPLFSRYGEEVKDMIASLDELQLQQRANSICEHD